MTTGRSLKIQTPQAGQPADPEPLPDPPPLPDGMQQNKHLTRADQTLETWFHGRRENVLVNGQGYLCRDRRNVRSCPVPDCVVAFDVDPEYISITNGYVISEVGKPPEFVLEVASQSTGERDYTVKRDGYAALGVGEYWRFDPSGGSYHDAPLAGDRLVDGAYAPMPVIEEADGLIWGYSPTLELDLCWDGGQLRFYDPVGRVYLPSQTELKALHDAAESRAGQAETRAEQAEARTDEVLLENERLREELLRLQAEG